MRRRIAVMGSILLALCASAGLFRHEILQLRGSPPSPAQIEVRFQREGQNSPISVTRWAFPPDPDTGPYPASYSIPAAVHAFSLAPGIDPSSFGLRGICLVRGFLADACAEQTTPLPADLLRSLRDRVRAPSLLAQAAFAAAVAPLLYCLLIALTRLRPAVTATEGLLTLSMAAALRALFAWFHAMLTVPDSAWFMDYFSERILSSPGSRGLVYAALAPLYASSPSTLWVAQLAMGAGSAWLLLVLLRSCKRPSRGDPAIAVFLASLPSLLAFESLVLSESFTLFVLLVALVLFREFQASARNYPCAVALGVLAALLVHTKPQFVYVAGLLALAIALCSTARAARFVAVYSIPLFFAFLFAVRINKQAGGFPGVSSMLGYSLFNHAQQTLDCPYAGPDVRIANYCQAVEAFGPGKATTLYTAWVVHPTMLRLGLPFHRAMEGYLDLSVLLLSLHPEKYARSAAASFLAFWWDEPWVVPYYYRSAYPGATEPRGMQWVLPSDRVLLRAASVAFFALLAACVIRRSALPPRDLLFGALVIAVVLGSAVLQALVESGENSRYAAPTYPLVFLSIAWMAGAVTAPFRLRETPPETGGNLHTVSRSPDRTSSAPPPEPARAYTSLPEPKYRRRASPRKKTGSRG